MATVPYRLESQEDLDEQDSGYPDPLAVADTHHSDVARAEAESEQPTINDSSELNVSNRRRLNIGKKRAHRKSLHKISDVRQRQGVTLRNVARRLGMEMAIIRKQEKPDSDLRISDLLRWQHVLDVPLAELLEDGEDQLSGPILVRSRMVKMMKTAAAIREQVGNNAGSQLVSQFPLLEELRVSSTAGAVSPACGGLPPEVPLRWTFFGHRERTRLNFHSGTSTPHAHRPGLQ